MRWRVKFFIRIRTQLSQNRCRYKIWWQIYVKLTKNTFLKNFNLFLRVFLSQKLKKFLQNNFQLRFLIDDLLKFNKPLICIEKYNWCMCPTGEEFIFYPTKKYFSEVFSKTQVFKILFIKSYFSPKKVQKAFFS